MKPINHHGVNPAIAHLGGKARRVILKTEERLRASGDWGAWERVNKEERQRILGTRTGWVRDVSSAWRNRIFSVLIRDDSSGVKHMGVASLSGIRPTWYEMQRIKDELFGTDSTAVEIYPPAKDAVDGSDMFHLWILPGEIPFGLTKVNASCGATTPAGELLIGKSVTGQRKRSGRHW